MRPFSASIDEHLAPHRSSFAQGNLPVRAEANRRFCNGANDLHVGRTGTIEQERVESIALYL